VYSILCKGTGIEYKINEDGSIEATYKGVTKTQNKSEVEQVFQHWKKQKGL
jgi:hypothetical protein